MEYPEETDKGGYRADELYGIGGWLAGFLVWLCLSIALSAVSSLLLLTRPGIEAVFAGEKGRLLATLLAIQAAFILLIAGIIILLTKHKLIFRTLYVVTIVADLAVSILLSVLLGDEPGMTLLPGWNSIFSVGIKVGWIIYLYKSKRVENTCPHEKEKEGEAGRGDRPRNDFI